jgi:BRCT domain type II-containing protein
MDLIRKLRYFGYLDQIGIAEREPGEVFEKIIEHLAATQDWSPTTSKPKLTKKPATKKSSRKATNSGKAKKTAPEPDVFVSEAVKLHYIIDRRDFLDKIKSVYASYAP